MDSNFFRTFSEHHSWLDRAAITMSLICAVHCLITPVILVILPIVASTFWVHEQFHLWMLFLVIPTTSLAIFMGCRKHKDRWVIAFATIGICLLITALTREVTGFTSACASCHVCSGPANQMSAETIFKDNAISLHALINTLGGAFLVTGHGRNFWLCRKVSCTPQNCC
ncbi:MAG: MerC domain-containing protein [Verrucomicrobiota bacterium]